MIYVSASQFRALLDGCRRKWAWRYVAGIKEPERDSMALGTAVHWIAEQILRRGADPAYVLPQQERPTLSQQVIHERAREVIAPGVKGLRGLYESGAVVAVEEERSLLLASDLTLTLRIDARLRDGTIVDHKTCASKRYALTRDTLRRDTQALTYAWALGDDEQALEWVYYLTRGAPESWIVRSRIVRSEWLAFADRATPAALWARDQILARTEPRDVECDLSQCRAYGGCPYRAWCSARASLADARYVKEQESMAEQRNLLEELRQRKAAAAAVKVPADPGVNPPRPAVVEAVAAPVAAIAPAPVAATAEPAAGAPKQAACKAAKKLDASPAAVVAQPPCVVYVDCVPIGQLTCDLSSIAVPFAYEVCRSQKVAHWQLCEYGKGAAILASYAREAWEGEPPRGSITTSVRDPLYRALIGELESVGALIVRGLAA